MSDSQHPPEHVSALQHDLDDHLPQIDRFGEWFSVRQPHSSVSDTALRTCHLSYYADMGLWWRNIGVRTPRTNSRFSLSDSWGSLGQIHSRTGVKSPRKD